MTSPIIPAGSQVNRPDGFSGIEASLGREDFLQLLVAQLKHQDPLNPMDGTQFASQLAEFSGLEQLIQVNQQLETQSSGDALTQVAINTNLASSLIGHEVLGFGGQLEITSGDPQRIVADVGTGGGTAHVRIFDAAGSEVFSRTLGPVAGGAQQELQFLTDGAVPAGRYFYQLSVTTSDGVEVPVRTYTRGTVAGVFFEDDGLILRTESGLRIPLDQLAEIEPAGRDDG